MAWGRRGAGIAINTDSVPALQQVVVDGTGTGGILQVNPGNLKAVAGSGTFGYAGDGAAAIAAQLKQPNGVAFDPSGNLYIVDTPANVVRKVATNGTITTFAGNGTNGFSGDGGAAVQAELSIPFSVTSDKNGNIFIQDTGNSVVRRVDATTGVITTFAGTPGVVGHSGDGGPATAARFNENQGARFDSAGNLYVPTCNGASIRKIDTAGNISTVAGNFMEGFAGDGGQATAAELQCPSGVAIDAAGNLYIADEFNQVIRKVSTAGIISTIAGTPGTTGFSGDGGAATAATFTDPNDVVVDSLGNLYVADSGNNRVRKIDTNGVITTAAGGLDNAGSAAVNTPLAVTVDTAGNVYFSDSGNSKIEEIFPQGTQPFPATQVGSTAAAKTLTLSNIGNTDVTLAPDGAFNLAGNSGDFAVTAGSCGGGAVLAANGGSCSLSITFTPTAVGQRTLTVQVSDDALNTPQSFSIGGTGTPAAGQAQTPVITWAMPAPITTATPLECHAAGCDGDGCKWGCGSGDVRVYAFGGDLSDCWNADAECDVYTDGQRCFYDGGGHDNGCGDAGRGGVDDYAGAYAGKRGAGHHIYADSLGACRRQPGDGRSGELPRQWEDCGFGAGGERDWSCDVQDAVVYDRVPRADGDIYGNRFGCGEHNGGGTDAECDRPLHDDHGDHGDGHAGQLRADGDGKWARARQPNGKCDLFGYKHKHDAGGTVPFSSVVRGYVTGGTIPGAPVAVGSAPTQVVSADVNGDGKLDLVVANGGGTMVTVLIGKGDGTYTAMPAFGTNYDGISGIAVADLNGDGNLDIATANGSTVGIFLGNGDGTFGAEQDFLEYGCVEGSVRSRPERRRQAGPGCDRQQQRDHYHDRQWRWHVYPTGRGAWDGRRSQLQPCGGGLQRRWQTRYCFWQQIRQHTERPSR